MSIVEEERIIQQFMLYMKRKHGSTDYGLERSNDRVQYGDYFVNSSINLAFKVWRDMKGYT